MRCMRITKYKISLYIILWLTLERPISLFKSHRENYAWLKESTRASNYSCPKYLWVGYNKNMGYKA